MTIYKAVNLPEDLEEKKKLIENYTGRRARITDVFLFPPVREVEILGIKNSEHYLTRFLDIKSKPIIELRLDKLRGLEIEVLPQQQ